MKDGKTFEQFKELAKDFKGKILGVRVYSDLWEDYTIDEVEIKEDEVVFLYTARFTGKFEQHKYSISKENFRNYGNSKDFPVSSHYPEGIIVFMNPIGSVTVYSYPERPKTSWRKRETPLDEFI